MHHLRFPDIVNSRYCPSSVFETYAAKNWAAHFREAHNMITEEQVYQAKQLCDANSQRYKKWLDVFWRTQSKKAPVGQDESLFRGSPERFTTLMIISSLGLAKVLPLLLEEEVLDLNITDLTRRRSALSWACFSGHEKIVEMLLRSATRRSCRGVLERSLDLDLFDIFGDTPLNIAAYRGHERILQLLRTGADPNSQDEYVGAPLAIAIKEGHERIVQQLLEKGANLNIQTQVLSGNTPLTAAIKEKRERIVQQLLEKGC